MGLVIDRENASIAFDESLQNNVLGKQSLDCLERIRGTRKVDDFAFAIVHRHVGVEWLCVHFKKPTVFSEALPKTFPLFFIETKIFL